MWSNRIAELLRELGHDALAVDGNRDLRGKADEDLFDLAVAEGRVLVTENVDDFRRLALRHLRSGGSHAGLILTIETRFPRGLAPIDRLVAAIAALVRSGAILENQEHWLR